MGSIRTAVTAVLMWIAAAGSLHAQCESAIRLIETPTTGTELVAARVAWNGSVLAVASNRLRDDSVFVTVYDEQGNQLFRTSKIHDSEEAEILDIEWNGDHFGLFYRDNNDRLILRRVSTSAELVGNTVAIKNIVIDPDDELDIEWNAAEQRYLIARRVNDPSPAVSLLRVQRDGTIDSNTHLASTAENSLLDLVLTESGAVGIFFEQPSTREIVLLRFQIDGPRMRSVWSPGDDLVVTAIGEEFVLARTVLGSDGRRSVRWKIIDYRGLEVRQESRLLFGTGKDIRVLSLISRGSELALSYLDARRGFEVDRATVRLLRFTRDGIAISNTNFAPSTSVPHREATSDDFLWTGSAYLMVATRESSDDTDNYLVRSCPLAAGIAGPRAAHRGDRITLTATPDGGVPPYEYEWRWGETGRASGPTLQQTFETIGDFTYTLTVRDDAGTVATSTFMVTVTEPPPPPPPPPSRRRAVRH